MHIFFAQRSTKKVKGVTDAGLKPRKVQMVAVLGGGLMGSGIATAGLLAGQQVLIKEVNEKFMEVGQQLFSVGCIAGCYLGSHVCLFITPLAYLYACFCFSSFQAQTCWSQAIQSHLLCHSLLTRKRVFIASCGFTLYNRNAV